MLVISPKNIHLDHMEGINTCLTEAWWHYQIVPFPTLLVLCAGNELVTFEFLSQRPLTQFNIESRIQIWYTNIIINRLSFFFIKYHHHWLQNFARIIYEATQYQRMESHIWYSVNGIPSRTTTLASINPICAEFFRGNIIIYLHFMSLLHIDKTKVLKILPQVRPGPTYST